MADLGHGHGGHGVGAPAHDEHGDHGHGHHASPMTRDLSGTLGVIAAAAVAILGVFLDKKMGPLFPGGGHHGEEEAKPYPMALRGEADVILTDARVIQPGYEPASVIAIGNGKILGVGSGEELMKLRTATTVVKSLHGAFVLPGLRDAHGHLAAYGAELNQRVCDLTGSTSVEDAVQRFATWMRAHPAKPGEWLQGSGWDESLWTTQQAPSKEELQKAEKEGRNFSKDPNQGYTTVPGQLPDSTELLDQVAPENPVILSRVDGHMAWVNHKALELAGIAAKETLNPPGGRILRDAKGEPTGILIDGAVDLVYSKKPAKPEDQAIAEARADILRACQECAKLGLVEVHDAGVNHVEELALRDLAKKGELPIRVYAMFGGDTKAISERLSTRGPQVEPIGGLLTIRAVKLYADGALGSHGARLLEPYSDDPKSTGLVRMSKEELEGAAHLCAERGWQVCVHAIGDAANRDVLEIFEKAGAGKSDIRWRVEHAQVIEPTKDIALFGELSEKLGVVASMQPTHATTDMRWAEQRLGKNRLAGAYAWRTLAKHGVHLAFGSDFPVESPSPLLGLWAAVTRRGIDGKPEDGWMKEQALTAEEALAAFTEGPAYASFAEARRGKILPGMDADLTVLEGERDAQEEESSPLTLLETRARTRDGRFKFLQLRVGGTWVAGKEAFGR